MAAAVATVAGQCQKFEPSRHFNFPGRLQRAKTAAYGQARSHRRTRVSGVRRLRPGRDRTPARAEANNVMETNSEIGVAVMTTNCAGTLHPGLFRLPDAGNYLFATAPAVIEALPYS